MSNTRKRGERFENLPTVEVECLLEQREGNLSRVARLLKSIGHHSGEFVQPLVLIHRRFRVNALPTKALAYLPRAPCSRDLARKIDVQRPTCQNPVLLYL
jgi:hypothetical protein